MKVVLAFVALAVAVAAIAWWRRRSEERPRPADHFELALGARLFAYSFAFFVGVLALLAIAFMLLAWSLE